MKRQKLINPGRIRSRGRGLIERVDCKIEPQVSNIDNFFGNPIGNHLVDQLILKHRLWKNWASGPTNFFDQIFNFCLHNIIVRKVLSNFCFWGPIRFVHWLEIDPVPSWRPGFCGISDKPDLKKFYLFKDKSFWLEIFFIFQGYTRATFLCTFRGRRTSGEFSVLLWSCTPVVRKSTNFLEKLA